jgi:hypothetical protein
VYPASAWFAAFAITVAIEVPIVATLVRRWAPSLVRLLLLIVFANLATHPLVWFVFSQPFLVGTPEYTIASEAWAVAAEAAFYWTVLSGISPTRAVLVSLTANVASFMVGLVVVELVPDLFV